MSQKVRLMLFLFFHVPYTRYNFRPAYLYAASHAKRNYEVHVIRNSFTVRNKT